MPSFWPSLRSPGDSFWLEGRLDWHGSHGIVGGCCDPTGILSPSLSCWWSKLNWNVTLIKSRKQSVIFFYHSSSTPRHQTLWRQSHHRSETKHWNVRTRRRAIPSRRKYFSSLYCIVFLMGYFLIFIFQIFFIRIKQLAYFLISQLSSYLLWRVSSQVW